MQLQGKLFPMHTWGSVKSKFERLKQTYKQLSEFESWTGNGGGDPDESEECFNTKYQGALKAGKVSDFYSRYDRELRVVRYWEL